MDLVMGYGFYFVLGHYLNKTVIRRRSKTILLVLSGIGFVFTFAIHALIARKTGVPCENYYEYHMVNVAFEAIGVFLVFQSGKYNREKLNAVVCSLSKQSFGVYLIHPFVLSALAILGLDTLSFHPILSVPVISIVVILISFAFSYVANKIPFINKWLV